ncbi:ATP-binding protein [Chitinimonas sp.]|uniref:ATP-binding protein n=1 Tax=Chitinimonas sp. TaxID=1934313 RepID=UPI0035B41E45
MTYLFSRFIPVFLRPQSLVARVYFLYCGTWLVFLGIGLTLFYRSQFSRHIEDVQQSASMMIEVAGQTVRDSAVIGDYDTIRRTLDLAVRDSKYSTAAFIDLSGGKIESLNASASQQSTPPAWLLSRVESKLSDVNRVISAGGKDYGVLRLSFDAGIVARELWQLLRLALLLALGSLAGGLLLIWFPLQRWLGHVQTRSVLDLGISAGSDDASNAKLIDDAPLEFRQALQTLQKTATQLRSELAAREQVLQSLRQIVANLLPNQPADTETASDLPAVISTIATLVSEREAANLQLQRAKEAADAASRSKSEFLANMSHEIRTPMNGVLSMIDLALDSEMSSDQRECLEVAQSSAKSLLGIINDILDFSKVEAGKVVIEQLAFDLPELLQETLKSWTVAAGKKGLQLDYAYAAELPHWIEGDPLRLRQVVNNLLSNAIKFTSSGSVSLHATPLAATTDGQARLAITVRDTGIGIAADKLGKIFEAFSQEDASTTRHFGGTGLGLTISSRLVELMGGHITVESEQGRGTRFIVTLPLHASNIAEAPQQQATADTADAAVPLHILVAEDNAVNQMLIRRLLEQANHRVTLVENGQLALEAVAQQPFDLLLMDMHMPVMGGIEATRLIRAHEQAQPGQAHLPIYALTAAAMAEERQAGMDAGLDGYLTKPIDRSELKAVLAQLRKA